MKDQNKRRKTEYILTVLLFLLMLTALPLSWYLLPAEQKAENTENRELASFPELRRLSDLEAFPGGFASWYTDHLPWKEKLVQVKSAAEIAVFQELDSDQVLLGKERPWLFYKKLDGEQIANYKHQSYFTNEDLNSIKQTLLALREELLEEGIGFALLIVPDKENIYGEYMPENIRVLWEKPDRTGVLLSYLEEEAPELTVVYPKEELTALKRTAVSDTGEGLPVYYESDTHWNRVGAKAGTDALFRALSEQDPEWEKAILDLDFTETAYSGIEGFLPGERMFHEGDLQKLCRLSSSYNSRDPYPTRLPLMKKEEEVLAPGGEAVYQRCRSENREAASRKLYVAGDSFRWHMAPYLQEGALESILCARSYLDLSDVKKEKPDALVYELPERYLAELLFLPGVLTPSNQFTEAYVHRS